MFKSEKREQQRRKKKYARKKSWLWKWEPYHWLSKEVIARIEKEIKDKLYPQQKQND